MTTKRTPKPQTDELAHLKARLDKQADDLAAQRQTITDLQKQIETFKTPLGEDDLILLKDDKEPGYLEVDTMDSDELRHRYWEIERKRNLAVELLGYAHQQQKRESRNECKLIDVPNERYARAWAALGVMVARGLLPAPILDVVGDDQAAGVCDHLLAVIGVIELAIEASELDG